MSNLEEVKRSVLVHFQNFARQNMKMLGKLLEGKELSIDEVDGVIDSLGKYQAHVICLRQHAKG